MEIGDLLKEYRRQRLELESKLMLAVEEGDWEGTPSMPMTDIQSQITVVSETIKALTKLQDLTK